MTKIWDIKTGKMVHEIGRMNGPVVSTRVTADGTKLIIGGHDNTLMIYDMNSAKLLHTVYADSCIRKIFLGESGSLILVTDRRFHRIAISTGDPKSIPEKQTGTDEI